MYCDKVNLDHNCNNAPNRDPNNKNEVTVPIVVNECNANNQNQGIRFAFDQNINSVGSVADSLKILATLPPIQTKVGDRVKLDAMVQINVEAKSTAPSASFSAGFSIERSTLLLGQTTPITTPIIRVDVTDVLSIPQGGDFYTRLASLTWVDTPPAGISTYIFRVTAIGFNNIESLKYSNRALNAVIFPISSSLN